ncbi:MAG: anaerobic glycerol-3-phosphate dehydrogenase subunit C [Bacillota bacterium]|nr:anaerobic glycerol-3-phosphate dehydrogenase subunit C [Bacillota bacterium]
MKGAILGDLDKCIKCGICTATCPVAAHKPGFSGPKHLGAELTRFSLDPQNPLEPEADYCCNCGSCQEACPSGVNISLLNVYYKSKLKEQQRWTNIRDSLLGRPAALAKIGSFNVGLTNFILRQQATKGLLEQSLALAQDRSFPQYAEESFTKWFARRRINASSKKVVYFLGCFTNYNRPITGKSVVNILEKHGFQVLVPKQGCCGLPLMANGYFTKGRQQGEANVKAIKPLLEQGFPIVSSCPSCTLMLKREYAEIFEIAGAEQLGLQVYDASEFLVKLKVEGQLDMDMKPLPYKLAYHAPCHLKLQGIGLPSYELLKLIPELEVFEIDRGCCGLSGSYGYKREKYEMSMAIGKKAFDRIREINSKYIATDCGGCGLQLHHGTNRQVVHPAELLWSSYEGLCSSMDNI